MSVAKGCCAGMGSHGVAAGARYAVFGDVGFVGDADVVDVGVNGIPWPLVDSGGRVLEMLFLKMSRVTNATIRNTARNSI